MKTPRPITEIDRLLAYGDAADRAAGVVTKRRRRTHMRVGTIDVVVVERTDEPTRVYLSDDEDSAVITEVTTSELAEIADAVARLLAAPPPVRRRR